MVESNKIVGHLAAALAKKPRNLDVSIHTEFLTQKQCDELHELGIRAIIGSTVFAARLTPAQIDKLSGLHYIKFLAAMEKLDVLWR